MRVNGYQGQLYARDIDSEHGFKEGMNLCNQIFDENDNNNLYISRIGISTSPGTRVIIDGIEIEIGKTGIYEVENVKIKNMISFKEDSSLDAIIDYYIIG